MTERIAAQIAFLAEADRLKTVLRASQLHDASRRENSAEHSWHVALYALILAEHAPLGVQVDRIVRMLLIHDLVEIDAGDHPIHGDVDVAAQAAEETAAADRLFGLLPRDQALSFRALWDEFEAAETPDAVYARSVDRLTTPIANLENGGGSWTDYDVTLEQLEDRVGVPVSRALPSIWDWLRPRLKTFFAAPPR